MYLRSWEKPRRGQPGGDIFRERRLDRIHRLLGDPIGVRKNAQTTIIGWLCCYTHLEMILAAGLNSFRVTSKPTLEVADSFFHSCFRPSISGSRGKSLKESVDFLDVFVGVNSDDGLWRFYDAGRLHAQTLRVNLIDLPRVSTESAIRRFREILIRFKAHVEQ